MRGRIAEQRNDLCELGDAARPAVGQDQRLRLRTLAARVDEVNRKPIDLRHELREDVQLALRRAPIETVPPMLDQLAHVVDIGAVGPALRRPRIRPARARQPRLQIRDRRIRHIDFERSDAHGRNLL
jgi:hypothetical protein